MLQVNEIHLEVYQEHAKIRLFIDDKCLLNFRAHIGHKNQISVELHSRANNDMRICENVLDLIYVFHGLYHFRDKNRFSMD